jgi:NAD(P)-dependent dehydrogenase (short-subunit alcohol dehydrogenase family)
MITTNRAPHRRGIRVRFAKLSCEFAVFPVARFVNAPAVVIRRFRMKIEQSVALVTGANRGIGRALVQALLAAGAAKVYAAARSVEKLNDLATDLRVVAVPIDVTDDRSITALAKRAADVTLLINNAGVLDFGSVLDAPQNAFERNFGTNFYGVLSMSRAFAPVIERNGGGAIVNILTLVALASMPGLGVYNASKAAAWSLTQSLRAALSGRKIAVYGVFPGAVDTDMLAGVEMPKTSPEDVARSVVAGISQCVEDIFPDPMSASLYEAWKKDHKAVEKQFATM